jgi:MoxR-like ATPase
MDEIQPQVDAYAPKFLAARQEVGKVIVGQKALIDLLFVGLLADGHLLLEGLPGLAKTLTINTLANVIQCDFKRIQFTPDLLPADLIGTTIYNPKEGTFSVNKGPVFTHVLLADEINRAPAKVQSALLEVMQEKQVTIAGTTFRIDEPYFVLATQNPIEHEGTYPLPEAQTDRFMMKIKVDYPSVEEEKEVLLRMGTLETKPVAKAILSVPEILEARSIVNKVYIDNKIVDYILAIVFATRDPERYGLDLKKYIAFGGSPRASIAFKLASKAQAFLAGRSYVTPQDVKSLASDILCHRIRRTYEAEADEVTPENIIEKILATLPVP